MQPKPFIHSTRNDAQQVRFDSDYVWIDLADGRIIGMPLDWFPWLQSATEAQRQGYESAWRHCLLGRIGRRH